MKRMPRGFEDVVDDELGAAIKSRHFAVRRDIDPSTIHAPALVDALVDFALSGKPLLTWGRAIEGKAA